MLTSLSPRNLSYLVFKRMRVFLGVVTVSISRMPSAAATQLRMFRSCQTTSFTCRNRVQLVSILLCRCTCSGTSILPRARTSVLLTTFASTSLATRCGRDDFLG